MIAFDLRDLDTRIRSELELDDGRSDIKSFDLDIDIELSEFAPDRIGFFHEELFVDGRSRVLVRLQQVEREGRFVLREIDMDLADRLFVFFLLDLLGEFVFQDRFE